MKKLFMLLSLLLLSLSLTGCGGGSSTSETNTPVTYNSAASEGELLEYTLDIDNLSYTYKITESQLGLSNDLKTGTLTKNADGTYTPSTAPDARVILLPNKMLVGATTVEVNGVEKSTLIAGVPKATQTVSFSDIAQTYNYAGLQCQDSPTCTTWNAVYGTFNVQNDGSWTECTSSNYTDSISTPSACTGKDIGTVNALENGKFQILASDGKDLGTAMYYYSPTGHKIMVVDLKDTSYTGYGRGMLVGVPQQAIGEPGPEQIGTWHWNSTKPSYGTVQVTGGTSVVDEDGNTHTMTFNSPWKGFFEVSGSSSKFLLADEGVYLAVKPSQSRLYIGAKID
jgi:hypothetical protein